MGSEMCIRDSHATMPSCRHVGSQRHFCVCVILPYRVYVLLPVTLSTSLLPYSRTAGCQLSQPLVRPVGDAGGSFSTLDSGSRDTSRNKEQEVGPTFTKQQQNILVGRGSYDGILRRMLQDQFPTAKQPIKIMTKSDQKSDLRITYK